MTNTKPTTKTLDDVINSLEDNKDLKFSEKMKIANQLDTLSKSQLKLDKALSDLATTLFKEGITGEELEVFNSIIKESKKWVIDLGHLQPQRRKSVVSALTGERFEKADGDTKVMKKVKEDFYI